MSRKHWLYTLHRDIICVTIFHLPLNHDVIPQPDFESVTFVTFFTISEVWLPFLPFVFHFFYLSALSIRPFVSGYRKVRKFLNIRMRMSALSWKKDQEMVNSKSFWKVWFFVKPFSSDLTNIMFQALISTSRVHSDKTPQFTLVSVGLFYTKSGWKVLMKT